MAAHPPIGAAPAAAGEQTKKAEPDVWTRVKGGPPFLYVSQRGKYKTEGYHPPSEPVKDPTAP